MEKVFCMTFVRNYIRLKDLGVLQLGFNVFVDESVILINPERMSFDDHVRIDAFCLISAGDEGVHFGKHVHVGAASLIFGAGGRVTLDDFSSVMSRATLITACDKETGEALTDPNAYHRIPNLTCGPITLSRHSIVGPGSVITPNVRLGLGSATAPLSYLINDVPNGQIFSGVPARHAGARNRRLLELAMEARG
jgi:dTDP-4-amino-4,6-dideoxy-D-glucose acyltransferase